MVSLESAMSGDSAKRTPQKRASQSNSTHHRAQSHVPIHWGKVPVAAAALLLLILGIVGSLILNSGSNGDSQTAASALASAIQQHPNMKVVDNQVDLAKNQRIARDALAKQGLTKTRVGKDIDFNLAAKVDPAGDVFASGVMTEVGHEKFLTSGTDTANAATAWYMNKANNGHGTSREVIQSASRWVAVQVDQPVAFHSNGSYGNGSVVIDPGATKVDPAGVVLLALVTPEDVQAYDNGSFNGILVTSRGPCSNPQGEMPTSVPAEYVVPQYLPQPIVEVPVVYTPPPTYVCVDAQGYACQPPLPPQLTCEEVYGADVCSPPPPPPPPPPTCTTGCTPPPPCTTDCTPPPCTTDCTPPPCTVNCTPPPCTVNCTPPPGKCDHAGAFCGTPLSGAEQQPVQDNGILALPTPGYTSGHHEQTVANQGPPCSGASCTTAHTVDGAQVAPGSTAPGHVTTLPTNNSSANSNASGNPHTTNPYLDTSNQHGTPAANTSASNTVAPTGDPLHVNLPNVPAAANPAVVAPAAPAATPNTLSTPGATNNHASGQGVQEPAVAPATTGTSPRTGSNPAPAPAVVPVAPARPVPAPAAPVAVPAIVPNPAPVRPVNPAPAAPAPRVVPQAPVAPVRPVPAPAVAPVAPRYVPPVQPRIAPAAPAPRVVPPAPRPAAPVVRPAAPAPRPAAPVARPAPRAAPVVRAPAPRPAAAVPHASIPRPAHH